MGGDFFCLFVALSPERLRLLDTNLVCDAIEIKVIQERLCTSQSRQKSFVDWKVRDVVYMVGENVLLLVLPMKGVMRFWKKGKLSRRFIVFEILERVREVAYRLALPPRLTRSHPVFHVSMLRKYHEDGSHVLDISMVQLDEYLTYEEEPIAILDSKFAS
ncbi:uncharacterized protein [Nicotiana sylvestris]|uniref:uncharacterized protein n=1 Tax=Nicotiana sylvestris TaxID=4096 RepID=UPI00388CB6E1